MTRARVRLRRRGRRAQRGQVDPGQCAGRPEGRDRQPQGADHARPADGDRDRRRGADPAGRHARASSRRRRRLDRAMVAAAWDGAEDADLHPAGDRRRRQGRRRASRRCSQRWRRAPSRSCSSLNKVDIAKKEELLALAARLSRAPEARGDLHGLRDDRRRRRRPEAARSPRRVPEGPVALPRGPGVRRHRPHGRRRGDPRAALSTSSTPNCPMRARSRPRNGRTARTDRPSIHQQILVERDSQKAIVLGKGGARIKAIGEAAREPISRASRPQGPPVPARQGQPELGRGPRPLPRHRARLGGLSPSTSSTHAGTSISRRGPSGSRRRSRLPWLGSRFISSVCAPQ